jgi:hypothetical protein
VVVLVSGPGGREAVMASAAVGNGLALGVLDGGGHAAAKHLRREAGRKAPGCKTESHCCGCSGGVESVWVLAEGEVETRLGCGRGRRN